MGDLAKAAAKWHAAKQRERESAAELHLAMTQAVSSGMSEVEVAKIAGVNRLTVRRALGKL